MGSSTTLAAPLRLLVELARVKWVLGNREALRYVGCVCRRLPQVWDQRSLAPADQLMSSPLRLRTEGVPLLVHSSDFGVVREIFGSRCYAFADWIARSRTFLDLGANEGLFSLFALAAHPANRVTAVEAQATLCERLRANLRRNGFEARSRVIQAVAGGPNAQLAALRGTPPPLTMAELVGSEQRIDFLKVDIEGSEFALFATNLDWLARVRFIAMELHPEAGDGAALRRRLEEHGLIVRQASDHGALGYLFLDNPSARA
ncbi:MAG: FkbM family methyltransferase [Cyanobacteriota bacterium]